MELSNVTNSTITKMRPRRKISLKSFQSELAALKQHGVGNVAKKWDDKFSVDSELAKHNLKPAQPHALRKPRKVLRKEPQKQFCWMCKRHDEKLWYCRDKECTGQILRIKLVLKRRSYLTNHEDGETPRSLKKTERAYLDSMAYKHLLHIESSYKTHNAGRKPRYKDHA